MPTLVRKRRPDPTESGSEDASLSPPPVNRRQSKTRKKRDAAESSDGEAANGSDAEYGDGQTQTHGQGASREQMVKKMVRMALACEYARTPIRRSDVGLKVLGEMGARQFKAVFDGAQKELQEKFGMVMVELPVREKLSVSQRRAAQSQKADNKAAATSKAWVLRTTLPPEYHTDPSILPPPKAPSTSTEASYTALYTFIISLISLSGGTIAEPKLDRYLRRTNADQYTPIDKTEKLLARLVKEGYILRDKDSTGGEEVIEYRVGPRGKVEVGNQGVSGLVRAVYGKKDVEAEELEKRLARSLGLAEEQKRKEYEKARAAKQGEGDDARRKMGGRRRRREDDDDDEDEGEDQAEGAGGGSSDDDD